MAAMLWSGIEAIFGINTELRFRLATMIAALLEPRGAARRSMYRRVKRLYNVRSRIVHGGKASDEEIAEHIVEVRALLSGLLCQFVEGRKIPSETDIEKLVFE